MSKKPRQSPQKFMREVRKLLHDKISMLTEFPLQNIRVFHILIDIVPDELILTVHQMKDEEKSMDLLWGYMFAHSPEILAIYKQRYGGEALQ